MRRCPSCHLSYGDEAAVCGRCGARLLVDTSALPDDLSGVLVGRVIGGNYRVDRLIGQGGMGAVYRARQLSLERDVAVKVLLSSMAMEREMVERFGREAKAASNIGHDGIIDVIDFGYLEEGAPFIVMELLEGEDLGAKLRRESAVPLAAALPVMLQVCDALQAAHERGIVHRDMKPDNVFLVYRRGRPPVVKLLDFGISKIAGSDAKLTRAGTIVGTPHYMPPEQIAGGREVDHRADVYACGVMLYQCLTGRLPYDGLSLAQIFSKILTERAAPPRSLRPDIPPEVERIILRAMEKDPAGRYQGMGELEADIMALAGGAWQAPYAAAAPAPPPQGPRGGYGAPPPSVREAPPISVQRSFEGAAGTRRGSGLGVVAAVAGVALVLVLVVAAAAAAVFLAARMRHKAAQRAAAAAAAQEEGGGEGEAEEAAAPPAGGEEGAAGKPREVKGGRSLGRGRHPFLCCGAKGCGLAFEDDADGFNAVYFRALSSGLAPEGEPVMLSAQDEPGYWPSCFAVADGGFLVLSQRVTDEGWQGGTLLDVVRVDAKGKAAGRGGARLDNMLGATGETMPCYVAAQAGGKLFVAWNMLTLGGGRGLRMSVIGPDGKEAMPVVKVNDEMVMATPVPVAACGAERCVVAWTGAAAGMSLDVMVSVVGTDGKVVEAKRKVASRSPTVMSRMAVPGDGGARLLWLETTMSGGTYLWTMPVSWEGAGGTPERVKGVEGIGGGFLALRYAAPAKGGAVVIAHGAMMAGGDEGARAYVTLLDGKGGAAKPVAVSPGGVTVEEAMVFPGADGSPVVVCAASTDEGGDEILAFPYRGSD